MKRFGGFIFILSLILGLAGCSREYQSERYLYKATKFAKHIIMAPDAVPPQEFNKALNSYELVFTKYPDTVSAKKARMDIGSLYLAKKDYINSRKVFSEVLKLYPGDKNINIEARLTIAKSYESQDLWDKAFLEYTGIIKDHSDTEIGLGLPVYIVLHYEKEKDTVGTDNAYREAIMQYKKIAEKNPNTMLGFRARDLIVMCYAKQENWQEVLNSLDKIVMEYPMAKTTLPSMQLILDISEKRFNNPKRAIDIFNRFLAKYPKHPINNSLKKGLEALNNVSVTKQQ